MEQTVIAGHWQSVIDHNFTPATIKIKSDDVLSVG
jgi:hypothetical protein